LSFDGIKDQNPKEKDPRFKAAVGTILKINDDTRYTDNSISNKTKVISMNNCGLEDYDIERFSELFSYSLNLDYLSLANNGIKTGSKILREIHHANLYKNNVNCNIKHLNLSNNQIDDLGFSLIATQIKEGTVPDLKTLALDGNVNTQKGTNHLIKALDVTTSDMIITIEKHNDQKGVLNFIKQAANYMFAQHSTKLAKDVQAEVLVYGDGNWGYCKKVITDFSRAVSVGLIHKAADKETMSKMKNVKSKKDLAAIVGGLLITAAKDAGDVLISTDSAYCMVAINEFFGFQEATIEPPSLGEFYDIDGAFLNN
jgi:hypothetical protein